ncbi:hypothetical protein F8M41_009648 [Gigaspora margarita]|uniref:Uncharacterized protein n=1 Tax=Gigaspora margarita TaxID=4874 RepID=A0A8H3X1T4_GIGMA|nr:hypothetical protein F8M41_009648 [Gigaspora margarita]
MILILNIIAELNDEGLTCDRQNGLLRLRHRFSSYEVITNSSQFDNASSKQFDNADSSQFDHESYDSDDSSDSLNLAADKIS